MNSTIYVILTTYKRQELAVKTIKGVVDWARYSDGIHWIVCDDGSGDDYMSPLFEAIGGRLAGVVEGNRHGVGYMMNRAIEQVQALGGQLMFFLEDDWELRTEHDFSLDASILLNDHSVGMVRYGYLSPGLNATLVANSNKLYWKVEPNGYQYRFTGHPSLRHIRFHQAYGMYAEGLTPGQTELDFCARVNAGRVYDPCIYITAYQPYGIFHHIGAESLGNIEPERK